MFQSNGLTFVFEKYRTQTDFLIAVWWSIIDQGFGPLMADKVTAQAARQWTERG